MPAISGKEYIDRINYNHAEIWIEGKQVSGKISEYPAFAGIMENQAKLFDQQLTVNNMTYTSPSSGSQVGVSFLEPKTKEDLALRREMIQNWARTSAGMLGRSPDYMNTAVMAFAAAASIFSDSSKPFEQNMRKLYENARERDLTFTHTFINPQVNRSQTYSEDSAQVISAKTIKQNKDGIFIKGARLLATQGGITDEILVFPTHMAAINKDFAYAFSVPSNTPGLRFLCRESFRYKESHFDHPLGSRFDEIDTIVVFDDVFVPWERVFCYQNPEASYNIFAESSFYPLAGHQVTARRVVKTEFILGVAQMLVDTINVGEYHHIQEKVSEIIVGLETIKALLLSSEINAKLDKWGTMAPDFTSLSTAIITYSRLYPRLCEILQQIGASGLVSIPTEADFSSEIKGDLNQYLQAANADALDRVRLFRLAWDCSMSSFGTRQSLYERYFFGDPVKMTSNIYQTYPREQSIGFVKEFLKNQ
ncbi:4-hydroxyphenylacetate 3-monooxygenase, oxygenase component [Neobacillus niacini]|uniref:4-hydroxyphenylacetate 3-monooxygenase, oxygenase component n=1 Tax=Neobacillus niacini TaxID=86668 RepID=UPI002858BD35|nr:4-hydroxyphenylacetate 3-monooxygenase, oxygenase component [Neobacillus niacini]MDR7001840.1 4-hydroxyphenylacetate 3-monooxygenase [Neobacillus niacini]